MYAFLRAEPDITLVSKSCSKATESMGVEALSARVHHASLDMAIDPFNFADALVEILAQRLAKTLCD